MHLFSVQNSMTNQLFNKKHKSDEIFQTEFNRKSSFNEHFNLKEDVLNLEKWFNDHKVKLLTNEQEKSLLAEAKNQVVRKHLETENEKFHKEQEPILNQNLLNFSVFDKNLENFQEKEKDKEKVKEMSIKKKTVFTFKNEKNVEKKYEPIKSIDTVKSEFRKQILNQIMVDKVIKRRNESNPLLSSNISSLDENNIWMLLTLPNFKCLKKDEEKYSNNLIEFDLLKEKIHEFHQKPKKHFELSLEEDHLNKISNDLKSLEEILLLKFSEINEEIAKKKKLIEELRNKRSNLSKMLRRQYEEQEVLIDKFNAIEQKLVSSLSDKSEVQSKQAKSKPNNAEFIKLEKFRGEKYNHETKITKSIAKTQFELNENKMRINEFNREIKSLNFNKMNIKLNIKEIYNQMLKGNDKAIKENGLVWLVKAYWSINEEVPFDLFPKNVDEVTKKFLEKYCKLDLEINYQNEVFKQKQREFTKEKLMKKLEDGKKMSDYSQNLNKTQIDEKVSFLKKNFIITHNTTDSQKNKKKNYITNMHKTTTFSNFYDNSEDRSFKNITDCDFTSSNMNLMNLQTRSQELKDLEITRIFELFEEKSCDIKHMKEKFILIFGKNESQAIFDKNLQKINKKNFEANKDFLHHNANKTPKNEYMKDNFNKLRTQIFTSNNLPDYHNSYLFFKQ